MRKLKRALSKPSPSPKFYVNFDGIDGAAGSMAEEAAPPLPQKERPSSSASSKSVFYDGKDEAPPSSSTFYTPVEEDGNTPPPKAPKRRSKLFTSSPLTESSDHAQSCPDVKEATNVVIREESKSTLNVEPTKRLSKSDESLSKKDCVKPKIKPKPQPRMSLLKAQADKPKPEKKKPELKAKPLLDKPEVKPKPRTKIASDQAKSVTQSFKTETKPGKLLKDRSFSFNAKNESVKDTQRDQVLESLRKAGVPPLPSQPPNASRLKKKKSNDDEKQEVNNNGDSNPTAPLRRKKTLRQSQTTSVEVDISESKPKTKPPRPPPPKVAPPKLIRSLTPNASPSLMRKNQIERGSHHCNSFTTDDLDLGVFSSKEVSASPSASPLMSRSNKKETKKETTEKRKRSRSIGFPFGFFNKMVLSSKEIASDPPPIQAQPEPLQVVLDAVKPAKEDSPQSPLSIQRKSIYPPPKNAKKKEKSDEEDEKEEQEGKKEEDKVEKTKEKIEDELERPQLTKQINVTDEDLVYENINNIPIYEGIEVRKGHAARIDLCTSGSLEGEAELLPLDSEIPTQSEDVPQENYYSVIEDDELEEKKPKVSRKVSRKGSRRGSRRRKRLNEDNIYEAVEEVIAEEEEEEEHVIEGEDVCCEFSETDPENYDSDSFTDDSDLEYENTQNNRFSDAYGPIYASVDPEVPMSKPQRIAMELLTTERDYVKKLHLLDQVFHTQIMMKNREDRLFPIEVIPMMFSNIKSIYQFHHDFLLPQLEKRMAAWDVEPKIGDVMHKFAPFLKLYTDYVKNFDQSMRTISLWLEKSPKFASFIEEKQRLPECENLTLQHHMLGPIQRVPRYELLLKDYQRHLEADSPDQDDTTKALDLVKKAASHSNNAMKSIEKFRKLLEINESLGGYVDVVSPTRELIKEGKVTKLSARSGYFLDRYIFLFNDLFLLCQSLPTAIIGLKQSYRLKARLEIDGMQVLEGDNLETPNTFYVKSKQKTIELHTNSLDEKLEWQVTLWNVIADLTKKQLSRKAVDDSLDMFRDCEVGRRAPTWIKDQETSMCMQCSSAFSTFKRRHHCRACGKVVCSKCSTHKAKLAYDNHRENRVCDRCHYILNVRNGPNGTLQRAASESPPPLEKSPSTAKRRGPGVLQVQGTAPSVISGYLQMSTDGKNWHKRWFAIRKDFVLYSFKAHQDVVAMTSTPLPGYTVSMGTKKQYLNPDLIFRISHASQKGYYFLVEDLQTRNRWVSVLEKMVLAELPTEQDIARRMSKASKPMEGPAATAVPTPLDADSAANDANKDKTETAAEREEEKTTNEESDNEVNSESTSDEIDKEVNDDDNQLAPENEEQSTSEQESNAENKCQSSTDADVFSDSGESDEGRVQLAIESADDRHSSISLSGVTETESPDT